VWLQLIDQPNPIALVEEKAKAAWQNNKFLVETKKR
jgi:hypothetical protein